MKALEIKKISKNFGGLEVLRDVTFSVEPGERRALIGPNGAGKTTLFNIISGTIKPNSGEIFLFGKNITPLATFQRARLGLARTFQKNNLFNGLSLMENINLALKGNDPVDLHQTLQNWNLWHKRNIQVRELSYGEQRQVEILLTLAQSPKLIMLDEPTAGMSPLETEIITKMIKSLPREIAVLIIEHDMEVIFQLADRITVLQQGQILCEGTEDEIKANALVTKAYLGTDHGEVRPQCWN